MTVARPCVLPGQFPLAHHTSPPTAQAMAQARAEPKPAVTGDFGPAWIFCKPKLSEAKPLEAVPEHH
ncbi:uncharacterized protein EDB91DRAFT_1250930 [Suillus paluster]|uniref:uncharacterized protein n=1 Tax=Suillus paluster TaxID=48578 RepID=UPI001B884395|nr:uncharacterized protein EDB91DRAFT_1250930 [Suillus paluster]KAG1734418.1 hypothetical protein EDB91DRAFT_1250930 [Suillus paluster]